MCSPMFGFVFKCRQNAGNVMQSVKNAKIKRPWVICIGCSGAPREVVPSALASTVVAAINIVAVIIIKTANKFEPFTSGRGGGMTLFVSGDVFDVMPWGLSLFARPVHNFVWPSRSPCARCRNGGIHCTFSKRTVDTGWSAERGSSRGSGSQGAL